MLFLFCAKYPSTSIQNEALTWQSSCTHWKEVELRTQKEDLGTSLYNLLVRVGTCHTESTLERDPNSSVEHINKTSKYTRTYNQARPSEERGEYTDRTRCGSKDWSQRRRYKSRRRDRDEAYWPWSRPIHPGYGEIRMLNPSSVYAGGMESVAAWPRSARP